MKRILFGSGVLVVALLALVSIHPSLTRTAHAQQYAFCNGGTQTSVACQSAGAGYASIAASAQTVVIQTSAITATSVVHLTYRQDLGTPLGVTCNTTAQMPYVSASTPGASFTIKTASTFSTNPGCVDWQVVGTN